MIVIVRDIVAFFVHTKQMGTYNVVSNQRGVNELLRDEGRSDRILIAYMNDINTNKNL